MCSREPEKNGGSGTLEEYFDLLAYAAAKTDISSSAPLSSLTLYLFKSSMSPSMSKELNRGLDCPPSKGSSYSASVMNSGPWMAFGH